jgi:hypothetical protein
MPDDKQVTKNLLDASLARFTRSLYLALLLQTLFLAGFFAVVRTFFD